jgi:hypothetical protein
MFSLQKNWKPFNLNLALVEAKMKEIAGDKYVGNQAHSILEFYFSEEPSQEIKDAIEAFWDGLDDQSPEAQYKSAAEIQAEVEAKKASGRAKLKALGLDDGEVSALVG